MKYFSIVTALIVCPASLVIGSAAKDSLPNPIFKTFQSTRIINAHSNEVLGKRMLDFRISHRFGDIGGNNGGHHSLWGLDQARDIRLGFEYGITDKLMLSIGRSKGAGSITEIFDGFIKYNLLNQMGSKQPPLSITVVGTTTYSGMAASNDIRSASNFGGPVHRLAYNSQLVMARKFSDRLALSAIANYTYRNFVAADDQNGMASFGGGGILRVTKLTSLTCEYFYILRNSGLVGSVTYYNPLAFGIEVNTGGHLFQVHVSNSGGIGENQFLPYTTSSWLNGEFRVGFTISRKFRL